MTRLRRPTLGLFGTTTATLLLGLAGAGGLSGCSQGQWSPTGDAMASAESRGVFGTPPAQRGPSRPARRSLVLAEDSYSRLATAPVYDGSPNGTATASVDEAP